MSILIKGMKMPTNCAACRIGHRDTGWDNKDNECEIVFCPLINQGSRLEDAEAKKHRLCPLVPIPPHGDLISRETAKLYHSYLVDERTDTRVPAIPLSVLNVIPTIIPAEEVTK